MINSPYHLSQKEKSSDSFYEELHSFSIRTYNKWQPLFAHEIEHYTRFLENSGEAPRSNQEYIIELITLAIFHNRYQGVAQKTPTTVVLLLSTLNRMRNKVPQVKKLIDTARSGLTGLFLYPHLDKKPTLKTGSLREMRLLLNWLSCTGEFADEVRRLRRWYQYMKQKGETYTTALLEQLQKQLRHFEKEAAETLGPFTRGVSSFHHSLPPNERWREDLLFRRKSPLEYHLNMVATEIINRGFFEIFQQTEKRILLVPACMCREGDNCRREERAGTLHCLQCSSTCTVGNLSKLGQEHSFTLNIVPHSSGAIQWLQRWKNQKEWGVVAVACPLNIVSGGYRMRELNIPSQCLLLEYAGCAKHWGPQGTPTTLNTKQLLKLITS